MTRLPPYSVKTAMLELTTTSLASATDFAATWQDIHCLRKRCGAVDDVLLDPLHFLAWTDEERPSRAVACWRGDTLVGILFATEHCIRRVRTGYAVGGDLSGRGLLLCREDDESAVIEASVQRLMSTGIHSLHLRFVPRVPHHGRFPATAAVCVDCIVPGDRICLEPDFDAFLGNLGKHTRRNIRAYMRKAAEEGITFLPRLSNEDFVAQRLLLNSRTFFKRRAAAMRRDDRLLRLHGGGQRMALQDAAGNTIALLCGFTHERSFYLLAQWNDPKFDKLSLSLVLRGFAIEHLIAREHRNLIFVGGTSASFARFCTPQPHRVLLIDRKRHLTAPVKRLLAAYLARRSKGNKPPSLIVTSLAGASLPPSLLETRLPLGASSISVHNPESDALAPSHAKITSSETLHLQGS